MISREFMMTLCPEVYILLTMLLRYEFYYLWANGKVKFCVLNMKVTTTQPFNANLNQTQTKLVFDNKMHFLRPGLWLDLTS